MSLLVSLVLGLTGFLGLNFFTSYVVNALILPFSALISIVLVYNLYDLKVFGEGDVYGIVSYGFTGVATGVVSYTVLNRFAGGISTGLALLLAVFVLMFLFRPDLLGTVLGSVYKSLKGGD